jgi:ER-bound oxygenase mpaB/B'/Rubber oxygenase, catalytic domain
VEVLLRTGSFSQRNLLMRLLYTFSWLCQVNYSLESIQPGGEAHISTIRVRLLHAQVRRRILKLAHSRPQYFNVERDGFPCNTLDSIHSICVFSCNHMWIQFPRFGIECRHQEIEDYIALFRYVAYLLGTPDEYFATTQKAKATMESVYYHQLRPTPNSAIVLENFVVCLADLAYPLTISRGFIEEGGRQLAGKEICDALKVPKPGLWYKACFQGQTWLFQTLIWLQNLSPRFDRFMTNVSPLRAWRETGSANWALSTGASFYTLPSSPTDTTSKAAKQNSNSSTSLSSTRLRPRKEVPRRKVPRENAESSSIRSRLSISAVSYWV